MALLGSSFFFLLASLPEIESCYYFSLDFYNRLLRQIINKTNLKDLDQPAKKCARLKQSVLQNVSQQLSWAIFSRHHLLFYFAVAVMLMKLNGTLQPEVLQLILHGLGDAKVDSKEIKPKDLSLDDFTWRALKVLKTVTQFRALLESFGKEAKDWETFLEHPDPLEAAVPKKVLKDSFTLLEKLLLCKVLFPDRAIELIKRFVALTLAEIEVAREKNLSAVAEEQRSLGLPLLLLEDVGADGYSEVYRLIREKDLPRDKYSFISLGQGQEALAEKGFADMIEAQGWLILQNCHLGK